MVPFLGLLLAVTVASPGAPSHTPSTSTLRAILQQYLHERGSVERITAASVAVDEGSPKPIVVAAAGVASPSSLFQIGSNTKAFTSTLALQLQAEGKLNIDAPIGKWLPQYPAWKRLTIRHMLDMTSGLPTYDNDQAFQRDYARNPRHYYTAAELVAYVYPRHGLKGWNYSNTGYVLTQMILERVTGTSYADLLRTRIFEPLHLRDTYFDVHALPPGPYARLVPGYFFSTDPDNAGLQPIYNHDVKPYSLSWTQAAGGIVSTPSDLTKWVRVLYAGSLLPAKQHAQMITMVSMKTGKPIAKTTPDDPRGFGLGVGEMLNPKLGRVWFYEGETLGYRVVQVQIPHSSTVIVVALNSQPNAKDDKIGDLAQRILAAFGAR